MTVDLTPSSETSFANEQVDLSFTLELEPESPTALLRTFVLLRRRCCRITEAGYRSGTDRGDHLALRVQAPAAHAHCVEAWLSALVEVRRVIRSFDKENLRTIAAVKKHAEAHPDDIASTQPTS